jgi:hypothetical protein
VSTGLREKGTRRFEWCGVGRGGGYEEVRVVWSEQRGRVRECSNGGGRGERKTFIILKGKLAGGFV